MGGTTIQRRITEHAYYHTANESSWGGGAAPGASLPTGVICIWHGLLTAIPTGWALCNGLNGTPDLREAFVKGAAAGADPGATGGASTHGHAAHNNHVVTQPAAHTWPGVSWPVNPPTNAAHTHNAHTSTSAGSSGVVHVNGPTTHSSIAPVISWPANVPILSGGNPSHTAAAVDAHSAHAAGSSEPAYYAVAFIMKL